MNKNSPPKDRDYFDRHRTGESQPSAGSLPADNDGIDQVQVKYFHDALSENGVTVHEVRRLEREDRYYIYRGVEQIWPRSDWNADESSLTISSLRMP